MQIEGGIIGWLETHRAQIRLSVRATVAALLAFGLASAFDLPQGYWAVFTAVIVIQGSVGGSVNAGRDWFIGTVGGAVVGIVVATLLPLTDLVARGVAIAVVVAPTALMAAVRPSFRVAPITGVIVVLGLNPAFSPLQSAFDRVLEIGIGSLIGVTVSLTVFPARAHRLVAQAAADALGICAALLSVLLEAIGAGQRPTNPDALHAALRGALNRLETLADEAARERAARLSAEPDPAPLARTLRRLRSDLAMVTRAADEPLPAALAARMAAPLTHVSRAAVAFLSDSATALRNRAVSPDLNGMTIAMAEYNAAFASLRWAGSGEALPDEAAGQLFALEFALEQLTENFRDLASRTAERAQTGR